MSKFAVWLCLAVTFASGCKNVAPMQVRAYPSPTPSTAIPTTSAPHGSAPDAVPQWKEMKQEPAEPKPKTNLTTIASSQKISMNDLVPPFEPTRAGVWKPAETPQPPTLENESKPESVPEKIIVKKDESKPASAPEKVVVKKGSAANQAAKTRVPSLSRNVWYAIAAVFGAVFTYIVAPIIVEIVKGRMAIGPQSRPA